MDVGIGARAAEPGATFKSRILSYSPDRVSRAVRNTARGMLSISESVFPGWVAYVDGLETPILRVNGMQRGVILPPTIDGQSHEVTFVYRPFSVRAGNALAMLSLAAAFSALAALATAELQARRRPARGTALPETA